jgi:hypothetical protein
MAFRARQAADPFAGLALFGHFSIQDFHGSELTDCLEPPSQCRDFLLQLHPLRGARSNFG